MDIVILNTDIVIALIIGIVALVIAFLLIRNRKDRKKLFPPESTDPVEEEKTAHEKNKDKE